MHVLRPPVEMAAKSGRSIIVPLFNFNSKLVHARVGVRLNRMVLSENPVMTLRPLAQRHYGPSDAVVSVNDLKRCPQH